MYDPQVINIEIISLTSIKLLTTSGTIISFERCKIETRIKIVSHSIRKMAEQKLFNKFILKGSTMELDLNKLIHAGNSERSIKSFLNREIKRSSTRLFSNNSHVVFLKELN